MDASALRILNDPALVASRDAHFHRLRSLSSGARPERAFVLHGVNGSGTCDPYAEPEKWVGEALDDLARRADALRDEEVFRPLVVEYGPYGVHFVDRILGGDVFDLDGTGNWQARVLGTEVGSLGHPDLERDGTWALARRAAEAFIAAGVEAPLLGMPTIASALNVAVNLHGEEFLVAMHGSPGAARRDLGVVNDVLCEVHRWYVAHVPAAQLQPVVGAYRTQPPGCGQLCGCTTQLVSPGAYAEFVAPLDAALLSVHPNGGMIHLCGTHTQHVPAWRAMAALRAVQLNDRAAEDLEAYFEGLRDDQVIYVNPTPAMTPERVMEITGGRRVVIVADLERAPRT